jgi:hypothetical protein
LDIGSFVLDADGVRWALDLGSDDYNMPGYFGRERWQYYRMTNLSHNTLVIDGQIQNPSARCEVTAFRSTPQRVSAVVDMSEAYKGQAESVRRGVEMLDRRLIHVRDEVVGATGKVRWGMVTPADISLDGNTATLTQEGKTLVARILSPADARFEIVSTKPPTSREKQNTGTRLLATTVDNTSGKPMTISVLLQPVRDKQRQSSIEDEPLTQWPK